MSHYDEVLAEARKKASGTAKEYIPRLYHILVDEENKTAEDARAIIEHDLIEYWAKTTVRKYLPQEAKDEIKVKAGKEGAKATNLVLAGGQTVTKKADDMAPSTNDEDPKDTEIDFLKEKVSELEDALRKTEQFKPANKLTEEQAKDMVMQAVQTGLAVPQLKLNEDTIFKWIADKADGTHSFYYDTYGIELFQNRILSQLKNSGVKVFKRLYFEI